MPADLSAPALKYVFNTVTASPKDAGLPSCTISTINTDREGDRVIPEGGDFANFMQSPVLMWAHGGKDGYASLPIGTVTALNVQPGQGITASWKWLEGDPLADRVKNAWDQGVVRASSIGYKPVQTVPNGQGMDIEQWQLLELSLCAIPMNPEAVRTFKSLELPVLEDAPTFSSLQVLHRDGTPAGPVILFGPDGQPLSQTEEKEAEPVVQKRGRVVSAVNESRLRAAMDALANASAVLTEVLAQLMPMQDEPAHEDPMQPADMPPKHPMPTMALDAAETYSLELAEDAMDLGGGLRLVLADDTDDGQSILTLIDSTGHEPTFTIDPAAMRAVIADAVRDQMQRDVIGPIGESVQRALNRARGRVE